jgi:hypothetical protein
VQDAPPVRRGECVGELAGEPDRVRLGQRTAGQPGGERLAGHQLHDQEPLGSVRLQAMQGRDIRVAQGGQQAGLALQAGEVFGRFGDVGADGLERDRPAQSQVIGAPDLPHAAATEWGDDAVLAGQDRTGSKQLPRYGGVGRRVRARQVRPRLR